MEWKKEGRNGRRIAIVGEGVVGMTTAMALRQAFPSTKLTFFSDRPFEETSSFGPAGIFRVDSDSAEYRKWAAETFEFWAKLAKEWDPLETGVQMVSGHIQSDDRALLEKQERAMAGIVLNFGWMSQRELGLIFSNPSNYGIHFTTFAAEGRRYVPWMRALICDNVKFVEFRQQNLESIQQLIDSNEYFLVINCAGLAAGKLAGDDNTVYPNRGVGIEVLAPGHSSHFVYQDLNTFCLPLVGDHLLLGTLRQNDQWERVVTKQDREDIWRRVLAMKPTLKNAKVLGEWCGLRPMRNAGIRLEHLLVENASGKGIHVIHNYGHGSNGFVLSWGCAKDIIKMIRSKYMIENDNIGGKGKSNL